MTLLGVDFRLTRQDSGVAEDTYSLSIGRNLLDEFNKREKKSKRHTKLARLQSKLQDRIAEAEEVNEHNKPKHDKAREAVTACQRERDELEKSIEQEELGMLEGAVKKLAAKLSGLRVELLDVWGLPLKSLELRWVDEREEKQ